jgi:hypothetical protein
VTKDRFAQGLSLPDYIDRMTVNRERFVRALDAITITPADRALLARLGGPRKILVITEDWCGTSLMHVPFVAKLVETDPSIELRVFLRDENPDVMDEYLKKGRYRSIPVFAFFDADMNELARFTEERPA